MPEYTHPTRNMTTEEWEQTLGRAIRDLRLRANVTQLDLARQANVNRTTLSAIERGEGGSISSLVKIVRALGREHWIETLAPTTSTISPIEMLVTGARTTSARRVRARRTGPAPS